MDQAERGTAENLSAVPRIQMLLKMLEWPGPDPDLTKYMQITPNEYKERPVLPTPLGISPPATRTHPAQKSAMSDSRAPDPSDKRGPRSEKGGPHSPRARQDARPKVDPYLVAIKDILENEHPPDISRLSKRVASKWNEDQYKKLGFKKFKEAVEEAIAEFKLGHVINQDTTITYLKKGGVKQSPKHR